MKPEEIAVLSAVISGVMTVITLIVGRVLSRRVDTAGAKSQEGDAAKALSEAARVQIETYNKEVITPIREANNRLEAKLLEMENRNRAIEQEAREDRERNRGMVAGLQDEIARIKSDLLRTQDALEYLVGATKDSHPKEVEVALKIQKGELHL